MAVDQDLVDAAIDLVERRFPDRGDGGAAAVRLASGRILTSTAPEPPNAAVALCHEVGALCEAYKVGEDVTASVCVVRAEDGSGFWILTPCGICQERLMLYGPDVEVGVPDLEDPRRWVTLRLRDVQPHWFGRVFPDETPW